METLKGFEHRPEQTTELSEDQIKEFLRSEAVNTSYFLRKAIPNKTVGGLHYKVYGFGRFTDEELESLRKEINNLLTKIKL